MLKHWFKVEEGHYGTETKVQIGKVLRDVSISLFVVITFFSGMYTVDEGHVGIVKRWSEARYTVDPGLHWKIPFADTVEEMEVRTRKYQETFPVSTTGKVGGKASGGVELQMPSDVTISANWAIPKDAALNIFKQYGGLPQYEDRILDPRVLKVTKSIFAKHSIENTIANRETVADEIRAALKEELTGHLASMTDINIEDIKFPERIRSAIQNKQTAKLDKEAEEYKLQKNNLEQQRIVNKGRADAESITLVAKAEAAAIRQKGLALRENKHLVELIKAEKWDGKLPQYMLGGNTSFLMQMPNQ